MLKSDENPSRHIKFAQKVFHTITDLFITHLCTQKFTQKDIEEFDEPDRVWSFASTKYLTEQDGVDIDAEVLFRHNYQRFLQFEYASAFKVCLSKPNKNVF